MVKTTSVRCGDLFRTAVPIPAPLVPFDVEDRVVFLGSCFAQHMGQRFQDSCLQATVNPVGALYNPASILEVLLSGDAVEAVEGPAGWHSWLTGTQFAASSKQEAESLARQVVGEVRKEVARCNHLVVTLGTDHCYELRDGGRVVANCHKHPQREFEENCLGVAGVSRMLHALVAHVAAENPHCVVTFTVSPYRYAKYGYHESQLSKAALLLGIEEVRRQWPERVQYFPAYEIVLDELRDYRFYEADMIHPSAVAVDYIWKQMVSNWATPRLQAYLQRYAPLARAREHVSGMPGSAADIQFRAHLQEQLSALQADYPMLPILQKPIKE